MRCLTLADALRQHGALCEFICRAHLGNLIDFIRQRGFNVHELPPGDDWVIDVEQTKVGIGSERLDWLVVDHYALDERWEKALRPLCQRLMVIDDLADRPHDCDLLLDQNYYCDQDVRYEKLLPKFCTTLLGPSYVLLRPEFYAVKQKLKVRDGVVKRILIFFGGSDPERQTEMVLIALERLGRKDILVDVIVGPANEHTDSIRALCNRLPFANYLYSVSNMAELIEKADLGVGAGGSAMWERCYLGLPTITVVFAENQVHTTKDVAQLGAIEYLGWTDSLNVDDYVCAISDLISNPLRVKQITCAALSIVQKETTIAVVNALLRFSNKTQ